MEKIALIGHSAAGKTSTLRELGIDPVYGDMDTVFGVDSPPGMWETLCWILDPDTPEVIAVVNDLPLLWWLNQGRRGRLLEETFARIRWVYLRKSRRTLKRHLALPVNENAYRTAAVQAAVLQDYGRYSKHFNALADHVIEGDAMSIGEVAGQVMKVAGMEPIRPATAA